MSRGTEVGIISGGTAAVIAPEFWVIEQGLVPLLVTEMKTLGNDVAQVLGMRLCVALCIIKRCLYSHHDKYSLLDNSIVGIHTRFLPGRFINNAREKVLERWLDVQKRPGECSSASLAWPCSTFCLSSTLSARSSERLT